MIPNLQHQTGKSMAMPCDANIFLFYMTITLLHWLDALLTAGLGFLPSTKSFGDHLPR
jgi:hypothetical protein